MIKFNDDLLHLVKEYFDAMLKFLLIQTYVKVFDAKNTAILYKKIVGLILRTGAQFWDVDVAPPFLTSPPRIISDDISSLLDILSSDFFKTYVNDEIEVSLMQDTLKNLEKFDRQIRSFGKTSDLPTLLKDSLWRLSEINNE
jgi:hypothetical protein